MTRLTVLYGHPTDPAEFDRYYRDVHIPLAKQMRGLKGWTIGKCESAAPGERPSYYMIVGLYADSRADLEAILASPEGQATVADVDNFATGGATFFYDDEQVLVSLSLPSVG
ncbi:EthD family reductase [bacterium]|nr:EthD family reductase [bacterium]